MASRAASRNRPAPVERLASKKHQKFFFAEGRRCRRWMVFVPFSHFVRAENTSVSSQAIELRGSVVNAPEAVLSDAAKCRLHGLVQPLAKLFVKRGFRSSESHRIGTRFQWGRRCETAGADLFDCASNGGEAGV